MSSVAALFVEPPPRGVYFGVPEVDPWDATRDARTYPGPDPVVAHPPCERWGCYWHGGSNSERSPRERQIKGNDGGCFATALHNVRVWGGVLEHPAASAAWSWFQLIRPPHDGGWVVADWLGGWTCHVEQGHYGHPAPKPTWLYACGVRELPSLRWGKSRAKGRVDEDLTRYQRKGTPIAFRDVLLEIARGARRERA